MELHKNGTFLTLTKKVGKLRLQLLCEVYNLQPKHWIPTGGEEADSVSEMTT